MAPSHKMVSNGLICCHSKKKAGRTYDAFHLQFSMTSTLGKKNYNPIAKDVKEGRAHDTHMTMTQDFLGPFCVTPHR